MSANPDLLSSEAKELADLRHQYVDSLHYHQDMAYLLALYDRLEARAEKREAITQRLENTVTQLSEQLKRMRTERDTYVQKLRRM